MDAARAWRVSGTGSWSLVPGYLLLDGSFQLAAAAEDAPCAEQSLCLRVALLDLLRGFDLCSSVEAALLTQEGSEPPLAAFLAAPQPTSEKCD